MLKLASYGRRNYCVIGIFIYLLHKEKGCTPSRSASETSSLVTFSARSRMAIFWDFFESRIFISCSNEGMTNFLVGSLGIGVTELHPNSDSTASSFNLHVHNCDIGGHLLLALGIQFTYLNEGHLNWSQTVTLSVVPRTLSQCKGFILGLDPSLSKILNFSADQTPLFTSSVGLVFSDGLAFRPGLFDCDLLRKGVYFSAASYFLWINIGGGGGGGGGGIGILDIFCS